MTHELYPAISVVLPVFNAEGTLEDATQSILGQTEKNFELIVVDDGSTDGSCSVINRYKQKDHRIRTFRMEHSGIAKALNFGLEKARGPYIARMDADDLSLARRIELQRQFLDERPEVGVVSCLIEHVGDKHEKAGYARYVRWINSLTNHASISNSRFIESPFAHPSVMFRKKLVETFGGYRPGDFPEDYELWLRWLEAGVKMEKIAKVLLKWRDEPDRLSRTHPRYSFEAFYRIKATYLARWLKNHNSHHPDVIIWGAGRTTRKRADMLLEYDINITHYIDIDPNKVGNPIHGVPVLGPENIPSPESCFIISYVGRHGANKMIRKALEEKGFEEAKNFIFAA